MGTEYSVSRVEKAFNLAPHQPENNWVPWWPDSRVESSPPPLSNLPSTCKNLGELSAYGNDESNLTTKT